jgi:hypothetical protein
MKSRKLRNTPLRVGLVYLGLALWLAYVVVGFFLELVIFFAFRAWFPEIEFVIGPRSLSEALTIQIAGIAVLPGLMLSILRRNRRYLLVALPVPIAVTVATFLFLWYATPEAHAEISRFVQQVVLRVWIGTFAAVVYSYDLRNLPGVCKGILPRGHG